MKHIEKYIGIALLLGAVVFNLYLYRLEPTAKVDPNDNLFQFALVYRTNQIWDFANKTCSGNILTFPVCHFSYLADHWVPNWNEGYNLPFYYSHIPQIVIVGTWRLIHAVVPGYSLFAYYHFVIYLLLCLFPISMFLAFRIVGYSWITAGFAATLASQLSTDGLYGLDPSSFLWRGYGLSSQLFAMIWLPLSIAYAWRYFISGQNGRGQYRNSSLYLAIIFLVFTTSGHLGIGIMAFLSLIPLTIAEPLMTLIRQKWNRSVWELAQINVIKLIILAVSAILILSYWIIPALLGDKFHNFSYWDPVWKFNSYGAKETITRFFNGDLFDFGRLPLFTLLVTAGIFSCLRGAGRSDNLEMSAEGARASARDRTAREIGRATSALEFGSGYAGFALLFIFWFLLYFGRTTWGNLINLVPSMKEFHLSRFIVGVHLAGLFLAPIGFTWIVSHIQKFIRISSRYTFAQTLAHGFVYAVIGLLVLIPMYQQTIRYNDLNNTLITRANGNYAKQAPDTDKLVAALRDLEKKNPGRVSAGRGGGWGKEFKIAETNMTMYLGNFAFPTVLWLPETWSPNGDTEQYFREDKAEDYDLYNIRYVATPVSFSKENIQPFWKLIASNPSWKLYEVSTSGYFTTGVRPAIVAADKYSRTNVVRLWIQSDDPKNGLYPELTFDTKNYPVNAGLPNFKMLDEVTFQVPGGVTHNIFSETPKYVSPVSPIPVISITDQTNDTDMIFSAKVTVPKNCTECLVILKQSYHPDWRVTVDGNSITPIITFPFFIGIPVSAGTHTIVASYEPSGLKVGLLILTGLSLIAGCIYWKKIYRR